MSKPKNEVRTVREVPEVPEVREVHEVLPAHLRPDGDEHLRALLAPFGIETILRTSAASEPRERSTPAERRARARVGESEGRSPSDEK